MNQENLSINEQNTRNSKAISITKSPVQTHYRTIQNKDGTKSLSYSNIRLTFNPELRLQHLSIYGPRNIVFSNTTRPLAWYDKLVTNRNVEIVDVDKVFQTKSFADWLFIYVDKNHLLFSEIFLTFFFKKVSYLYIHTLWAADFYVTSTYLMLMSHKNLLSEI